jgi:hypothetical protein
VNLPLGVNPLEVWPSEPPAVVQEPVTAKRRTPPEAEDAVAWGADGCFARQPISEDCNATARSKENVIKPLERCALSCLNGSTVRNNFTALPTLTSRCRGSQFASKFNRAPIFRHAEMDRSHLLQLDLRTRRPFSCSSSSLRRFQLVQLCGLGAGDQPAVQPLLGLWRSRNFVEQPKILWAIQV